MAYLQIPAKATEFLLSITDNKYLLLFLINVLLLLLGMIMDMAPLILIVTPILYPVLVGKFGMSPIHFGIMLMINLAIGLCTHRWVQRSLSAVRLGISRSKKRAKR